MSINIAVYVDDLCIAAESPSANYSNFQVKIPFKGQRIWQIDLPPGC